MFRQTVLIVLLFIFIFSYLGQSQGSFIYK